MPSKFSTFKLGAKMPLVPGFGENSVQRENVGRFSDLRSLQLKRQTQAEPGLFRPGQSSGERVQNEGWRAGCNEAVHWEVAADL